MRFGSTTTGSSDWQRIRAEYVARKTAAPIYDGFISYRHTERQTMIARALQRALHGFAKPLFRLRAVRLYRDETNLSARPDLWGTIRAALDQSLFLLLMASPEAAASYWVEKEVTHWLDSRSQNSLLIVVTDGRVIWNTNSNRFDPSTTALPPSALSRVVTQPFWIDLTWVGREARDLRIEHAPFRDTVASLAATLRGIDKDVIYGEDLRERRRALRLAYGASALIGLLGVAASVAAIGFLIQLNAANRALASGIWKDLNFARSDQLTLEDVSAIWRLAIEAGPIRRAFVDELVSDPRLMQRFGRWPAPVERALGLFWPPSAEVQPLLTSLEKAIRSTTEPDTFPPLAQAVRALSGELTGEQARALLTPILQDMQGTSDPEALRALAGAVSALATELTGEQVRDVLTSVLEVMQGTQDPDALRVLARAASGLAGRLTSEQARALLAPILQDMQDAPDPDSLLAFAQVVQVLPAELTSGQVQVALAPVLRVFHVSSRARSTEVLSGPLHPTNWVQKVSANT